MSIRTTLLARATLVWATLVVGPMGPLRAEPIAIATVQRADAVLFEKDILPILQRNCLACHNATKHQGELVLESPDAMKKGGDSGPAIVPGKGIESRLLKLAAHQEEPAMPPLKNAVNAQALTPEELGLIRLWIDQGARGSGGKPTLSPKSWQRLSTQFAPVMAVALTPDGQYVAAGRGNQLYLYHVPTGRIVARLDDAALSGPTTTANAASAAPGADSAGSAHLDIVTTLAFNRDGDLLASGSFREVKLWRRPRDVQKLQLATGAPVTALAVSPNSQWIATTTAANGIRLWNAATGQAGPSLAGHVDRVTALRFAPDGGTLASSSLDQTARLWKVADGSLVGVVESLAPVHAVEFVLGVPTAGQPTPLLLATGGADNLIRTWSLPTTPATPVSSEMLPRKLESSLAAAQRLVLSRDRQFAAATNADGLVRVWRQSATGTWDAMSDWKLENGVATAMDFVPRPAVGNMPAVPALATAAADGTVSIWNLPDHALLQRWRCGVAAANSVQAAALPQTVSGVAVSADGKQLASGAENGTLAIWDLAAPAPPAVAGSSGTPVAQLVMSPSRKLVAVAGVANGKPAIIVRNLDNGQVTHTLAGHEGPIRAIGFSADSARLASGSDDLTVRVWDLGNAQQPEQKKLIGLKAAVTAVGFSPDGAQLLSASADNLVRLWNLTDGMPIKDFAGHAGVVHAVGFFSNQPFSVSVDRTVRFWNPADGAQARAFESPSPTLAVATSVDGQRVALSGEDKQIRVYQLANGQLLQALAGHASAATSLSFSMDAKRLAATSLAAASSETTVWDPETNRLLESFTDAALTTAAYGTTPDRVLIGDRSGGVAWRMTRFLRHLDGNTQAITGLVFHSNGQLLFTSARDGSLRGYTTANGQAAFGTSHGVAVNALVVSPNEQILATAGENNTVRFWATNGGGFGVQQVANLPGPVKSVGFSADNTRVVVGTAGEKPTILALDIATGTLLQRFTGHAQAVHFVSNTDETGQFLSASADGTWTRRVVALRQMPGHGGIVTSLAAIPGTPMQLMSGSIDTTIRRWNLDNGQAIAQFAHGGPVTSIAVRGDGQRFASASDNHVARLWNINGQPLADLRADIRRKMAVARLTQQQTATTERVNIGKQRLDAAEKDVPVKTDLAQKAAAALTAAATDMQQKQVAMTKTLDEKTAVEKASIAASAEARKMQLAKTSAEETVLAVTTELQVAQQRSTQRAAASAAAPNDAVLKKAAMEAQEAVTATQQKQTAAQAVLQTATQALQTATTAANEAAQKATTTQKPYNDALAALKTAESVQNLAAQQQAVTARELEQSKAVVPLAKDLLVKAEAALAETKQQLEIATKLLADSDQAIRSVTFSPDGRALATGGDFENAHLWDGETGVAIAALAGHKGPIGATAFLGDSQLVTGSADQAAITWELNPEWRLERTIGAVTNAELITDRVMALDFNADGTRLLVGGGVPSRHGELHVFNTADGARTAFLPQAHDDVVHSAKFSPDGKRIASGGADKYLRTFDLASGQMLRRFEGHTNYVLGVAWKTDGQTLVSAAADNTVKVWDPDTGDQRLTIPNFTRHVTSVRFIGDTDNIVSGCGDRIIRMHVASNGGNFRNFPAAPAWLHSVDVIANNEVVAAGTANGMVFLWNGNTGQALPTIRVGQKEVAAQK